MPDIEARPGSGAAPRRGAALAGVSVEYYSKLERGAIAGVSASVLDAITRALHLDDAERAHMFHLAHAADGTSAGMRPAADRASAGAPSRACDGCSKSSPPQAIIRNGRMDLLASNHLGRAMHASIYDAAGGGQPNFARFTWRAPASGAIKRRAPDGIRTHAGAGLSRLPLPFGLRGPAIRRPV
jgi:hypothetical protein